MTDVREAFEAWAGPILRFDPKGTLGNSDPLEWVVDWDGSEHYYEQRTHWMFEVWQASRKAALEEAAKVCDRQSAKSDWHAGDEGVGCDKCADLIRALAAPAATGEEG